MKKSKTNNTIQPIKIYKYSNVRFKRFEHEKKLLADILSEYPITISMVNEGSVKFSYAESTIDICVSLEDLLDLLAVNNLLNAHDYKHISTAYDFSSSIFYHYINNKLTARIYICHVSSDQYYEYTLVRNWLKSSYRNLEKFNNFTLENYTNNKNNPPLFYKQRKDFFDRVVATINSEAR